MLYLHINCLYSFLFSLLQYSVVQVLITKFFYDLKNENLHFESSGRKYSDTQGYVCISQRTFGPQLRETSTERFFMMIIYYSKTFLVQVLFVLLIPLLIFFSPEYKHEIVRWQQAVPQKHSDIHVPTLGVVSDFMNISRVYALIHNSVVKSQSLPSREPPTTWQ